METTTVTTYLHCNILQTMVGVTKF